VPEGHALLDLSLGPSAEVGPLKKALYGAEAGHEISKGKLYMFFNVH